MVQNRRGTKLACSPEESNVTNAHAGATYLKARFPPFRAVAMYLACPLNLMLAEAANVHAPTMIAQNHSLAS